MLDTPIRKRVKNYPKDFTPPVGYLTNSQPPSSDTQHSSDRPGHINRISHNRFEHLNKSTQLSQNNLGLVEQTTKNVVITINPQQSHRHFKNEDNERQNPLVKGHNSKRKPYINPQLLNRPRIQDNQEKELIGLDDDELDESSPGSIKKNIGLQKPLQQQQPNYIIVPSKQAFSSKKMLENDNIFYESLKNQYSNFNNLKQKKLPTFLKSVPSNPEASFKLQKKIDPYSSESHLQTPRQRSEDKQKARLIQFSGLMEQRHIDKLKSHINNIAFQKSKLKVRQKILTNESQGDHQDLYHSSRKKTNHYSQFHLSDGHADKPGEYFDTSRINNSASKGYTRQQRTTNWHATNAPNIKTISISYKKTSLSELHKIYSKISQSSKIQVQIQIPTVFRCLNESFSRNMQKQELYESAAALFQTLALPSSNLTIKRYSNCILMTTKNICVLWHYDGKVYIGGWVVKYLDEGCKMGLGLEWVPNCYVYYGEYVDNKRNGLGVMKDTRQVYIGEWAMGQKTGNGRIIRNGWVKQNQFHGTVRHDGLQFDPFP